MKMIRVDFTYLNQPPKRYTFEQKELKKWVEKWCRGKTLNLFAGKTKLDVNEVRVDMDPEMPADFNMTADEFLDMNTDVFDTVILDPPYSLRKAHEKYQGRYMNNFTRIKEKVSRIVRAGGRVISFGYDSTGMSRKNGFKKIAVCLVNHKGMHNDTIGLVEEKYQESLLNETV